MSDQTQGDGSTQAPQGQPAAPAQQQPAQQPAVPPQATQTQPTTGDEPSPTWLPSRLKQARQAERNDLLKEFGASNPDELKAKLKRLDELESEQLSEKERTEKLLKELAPKAEQAERLGKHFAAVVEAQFSALPEAIQAAIDAKAEGDAEKRWELIQVMQSAGVISGAPATPQPKPAQTAPAGVSPPPQPATPKTPYDKWVDMQKTDSVGASMFYQLNAMAIEQSRNT